MIDPTTRQLATLSRIIADQRDDLDSMRQAMDHAIANRNEKAQDLRDALDNLERSAKRLEETKSELNRLRAVYDDKTNQLRAKQVALEDWRTWSDSILGPEAIKSDPDRRSLLQAKIASTSLQEQSSQRLPE